MRNVSKVLSTVSESWECAETAFLNYCKAKRLSPKTIDYYSYRLLAFQKYLKSHNITETPTTISVQTLRAFIADQTETASSATARHSYSTLRVFYVYMIRDGFVDNNPMLKIDKPRGRQKIIETFSESQLNRLLATCDTKTFTGSRDRAMLLFMLDSGVRATEICEIQTEQISWTNRTALVTGKGDKERNVCFGITTAQALTQYIAKRGKQDNERLFVTCYGEPMNRYRLRNIIVERCKLSGITGVRCSPHSLRHTCAVTFLRNGASAFDVQKLLGHSSLDMTRRYVSLVDSDLKDAHAKASPVDNMMGVKTRTGRIRLK